MINTIARYSFNEVDRAARDEFERDSLYKSFAVAFLVVQVMTIVTGAVLAWVLPGVHALWALAVFVPFVAGEIISSTWLKTPDAASVGDTPVVVYDSAAHRRAHHVRGALRTPHAGQ